jgi:hypothetical protein
MTQEQAITRRYFVSYSGIKLPLKLVNEITEHALHNRNTYFCGHFDTQDHLVRCQKVVYGEVESEHVYSYHDNGALKQADIIEDDETRSLTFPE